MDLVWLGLLIWTVVNIDQADATIPFIPLPFGGPSGECTSPPGGMTCCPEMTSNHHAVSATEIVIAQSLTVPDCIDRCKQEPNAVAISSHMSASNVDTGVCICEIGAQGQAYTSNWQTCYFYNDGEETGGGGPICFSSSSTVTLANSDQIPINQLQPGDHLMAVNENGDVTSAPFLGWLHRDDNLTTTFLDITTESGRKVSLSPSHLITVTDDTSKTPSMKFANTVRVGDYLWSGESGLTRVKSVTSQRMTGVYAPLTSTGTLLVDDILASTYAHLASQKVAHLAFLPYRMFPKALQIQDELGLTPYILPLYNILTKIANPVIEVATNLSQPTVYNNPIYTASGFMAGLISVAFVSNKIKAF